MKLVIYVDNAGYKRPVWLRDQDPDNHAKRGVPVDMIDVDDIDWEYVKREIHNMLVDRGLFAWKDVQGQGGLKSGIGLVLRRQITGLMKQQEKEQVHYEQ
jgi:predicted nuclease with TOPRIM domain